MTSVQNIFISGLKAKIKLIQDQSGKLKFMSEDRPIQDVYAQYPIVNTYLEHHIGTPHGLRMAYNDRPYLADILKEKYDRPVIIQKCVQVGISEYALATAFTYAEAGLSVLYVLPNHSMRSRFVGARVDKAIERSPKYRSLLNLSKKDNDSRSLKHFGKGCIYFVGSNTMGELSELAADMLIIDEYDLAESSNLPLIQDRLMASKYKYKLYISNPRKHGPSGIGTLYNLSDQKVWMVSCDCGHEQELSWDKHFVIDTVLSVNPVCSACSKPFNRLNPGRWVGRASSKLSGYKISQLYNPGLSIENTYEEYLKILGNDHSTSIFYGSILGEYYTGGSSNINIEILTSCIDPNLISWPEHNPDKDDIVIGIDVGKVLHYTVCKVMDRRMYLSAGTLPDFESITMLITKYNPNLIVIDAMPETHSARNFAQSCPVPVFLCRFVESAEGVRVKYGDALDPVNYIHVNRTFSLDGATADIFNKQVVYPKSIVNVPDFTTQMLAPRREYDNDKEKFMYTKGTDHYRFADVYQWVGCQLLKGSVLSLEFT